MISDDSRSSPNPAALPPPPFSPLSWPPLGSLLMRPWYDRLAVKLVARWFLPLSRAWATALESGGSEARFAADLGLDGLPGGLCGWQLARALTATAELAKVHAGADAHWHDVFFAAAQPGDATLVA
ncbi:MAG TPA: hypothetical protein VIS03_13665, partial [Kiloniellaceae bacterium]